MHNSSTFFTHAIARKPGKSFPTGLTSSGLGVPNYQTSLEQHKAYCQALEVCGCELTVLEADERYPDSTFVEDTTVIAGETAVITNPGADTRKGEVPGIRPVLEKFFDSFENIESPGTLDGGDICQADDTFFIGISERTNPEGAGQLSEILAAIGYKTEMIDIRRIPGSFHLKSDLNYLGDGRLLVSNSFVDHPSLSAYEKVIVDEAERYAANCVRVNDHLLIPDGFPRIATTLSSLGYQLVPLQVTEFRKMDGGLSCLSLRFSHNK